MSFGPATVTALTAATADATTLVPCSKASARNEIELDELLQAALNVSATGLAPTVVTPTALAANTDNWASATGAINRVSASAAYNLTGIAAPTQDGTLKFLWNVGTFPITLIHELTSTAANRFTCAGGASIVLGPGELALLTYSTTTSRWLTTKVRSDIGQGTLIVRQSGGVAGTDEVQISHDGSAGLIDCKDGNLSLRAAGSGTVPLQIADLALLLRATSSIQWGSSNLSSPDTGLKRAAAAVVATTNGSTGTGWLQNSAGTKRVTGDVTNATTTFADLTDLTVTLIAGRKYVGRMVLFALNSVGAEGVKLDFNGGTATATSFIACTAAPPGGWTYSAPVQTTLAGVIAASAINTAYRAVAIELSIVCSGGGTFIPRFAENSTGGGGTVTVSTGTYLVLEDSPN